MRFFKVVLVCFLTLVFCEANEDELNKQVITNLYEKVIKKNTSDTINNLNSLEKAILNKEVNQSKEEFNSLVKSWKSVQSFYILGEFDDNYIDVPRLMDIFHHGNEDIKKQLDLAIKSSDETRVVLFKNSLKSINALEYILFEKDITNDRINKFALTIVKRLKVLTEEIIEGYEGIEDKLYEDLKKSNSVIINTLIQNSYKLKEWRVADVAGLNIKYKGKPSNERGEYYISKNSTNAIIAILNTYNSVLNDKDFYDFGDFLKESTQTTQLKVLRDEISKAINLANKIENDDLASAKELFESVNSIHVILFVEMIEELQINAKILDADGD